MRDPQPRIIFMAGKTLDDTDKVPEGHGLEWWNFLKAQIIVFWRRISVRKLKLNYYNCVALSPSFRECPCCWVTVLLNGFALRILPNRHPRGTCTCSAPLPFLSLFQVDYRGNYYTESREQYPRTTSNGCQEKVWNEQDLSQERCAYKYSPCHVPILRTTACRRLLDDSSEIVCNLISSHTFT